jgi:CheY-like chemotaxis protein
MPIRKALLVDDDPDILRLCEYALRSTTSWAVVVARSARAAIDAARVELPDVILLDMMMPDVPGIAVLSELKALPLIASIPIVLMTAGLRGRDSTAVQALGAAGVLAKPFDPIGLSEAILGIVGDGNAS